MHKMKNLLFAISFILMNITAYSQNRNNTSVDQDGNIVGLYNINILESNKYSAWFSEGYNNYSANSSAIDMLLTLPKNTTFLVFGGVWCEDTRKLVPQFCKVMDLAGIKRNRIQLYLLDKNKTSPAGLESQYSIHRIPTFIIMRDGKEIGRIVESVGVSIEYDLVEVSGLTNP